MIWFEIRQANCSDQNSPDPSPPPPPLQRGDSSDSFVRGPIVDVVVIRECRSVSAASSFPQSWSKIDGGLVWCGAHEPPSSWGQFWPGLEGSEGTAQKVTKSAKFAPCIIEPPQLHSQARGGLAVGARLPAGAKALNILRLPVHTTVITRPLFTFSTKISFVEGLHQTSIRKTGRVPQTCGCRFAAS